MLTMQDKKAIKQKIQSNKHQVYIVSLEEMSNIVKSTKKIKKESIQKSWDKLKVKAEVGASYTASAGDAVLLTKLVGDLGGVGVKAYVKTYGGKPHIILKGKPGLRKILSGTKYGIKNPKVVTMGLGKVGAVNAAKMGGILSVVLITGYRVIDYFITDKATLTKLIGYLAVDIVKIGIATGASIAAAHIAFAMTSVAIGPIFAVLIIGTAITLGLNTLDNKYKISANVVIGLDELNEKIANKIAASKDNIIQVKNELINSVIDYTIESAKVILVNFAKHNLSKYMPGKLKFN